MELDADIRNFLDSVADEPRASELPHPVAEIRRAVDAAWRDVPRPDPEAEFRDFTIPGRFGPVPVRHYLPDGPANRAGQPLVVFAHGGGFVFGNVESHHGLANRLCLEAGVQVLSVDYRLAPEHPFPAGVTDMTDTVFWCAANHAALGADPGRLFVAGDSAGGNFAAVAAHVAFDEGLQLAGQILIYPATDLRRIEYESRLTRAEGYGLNQADMWWYLGHYLSDPQQDQDPLASPMVRDSLAGLAPAFVMTAGYDPLHSEGEAYAQRLAAAGVEVEYLHLPGANHGVFSNYDIFRSGEQTWQAMLHWLSERLQRT